MSKTRSIVRLGLILLLVGFALTCYLRRVVLVTDPYWNLVLNWRGWQQQLVALTHGRWLITRHASDWTEAQQIIQLSREQRFIFTPYWRADFLQQQVPEGKTVWLISPTEFEAAVKLVSVGQEQLFRAAGEAIVSYLEKQQQRERVVAYFYGGDSYDASAVAFASAFESKPELLDLRRGYTSQWGELEEGLKDFDAARGVLVLALGELNPQALGLFEEEDRLLFVTEDNRYPAYLQQQQLLSIERDYRGLFRSALARGSRVRGYLYLPDSSPLKPGQRQGNWYRRDAKLWQWALLLWQ